jgi:hypothetical protein
VTLSSSADGSCRRGVEDPHLDDVVIGSMAPMKPPRDSRVPRGRSLEEVVHRLAR